MQWYQKHKDKIKSGFIQEKNRIQKGLNETTTFKYFVQLFIIIDMWVKIKFDLSLPIVIYIILSIFVIFGFWVIGKVWDEAHLFDYEAEFANKRNWFVEEMRKMLKEAMNGK